jgi:hypothetical protein
MAKIFATRLSSYKDLDYVSAWFVKATDYIGATASTASLVSTNSITQGEQVAMLWPIVFRAGIEIGFCHTSFPWKNNAANNAGVTCVIIGLRKSSRRHKTIFEGEAARAVHNIGPYLTNSDNVIVRKSTTAISDIGAMASGNKPTDGGNFSLSGQEREELLKLTPSIETLIKRYAGSREFINGISRWCVWINDDQLDLALSSPEIARRVEAVKKLRLESRGKQANDNGRTPHKFVYAPHRQGMSFVVPSVSSERREYLPCGLFNEDTVVSNLAQVIYDAPLWNMALIASRLHLMWIATVCGKMKTDFRYSNTLGWNTFPVPPLTENQKAELTRCAEDILLAREAHFPATIADLYDPDKMPDNLRAAHDKNDETLERIYIGRRFKNDTERLEKLFDMYTKMSAKADAGTKPKKARKGAA